MKTCAYYREFLVPSRTDMSIDSEIDMNTDVCATSFLWRRTRACLWTCTRACGILRRVLCGAVLVRVAVACGAGRGVCLVGELEVILAPLDRVLVAPSSRHMFTARCTPDSEWQQLWEECPGETPLLATLQSGRSAAGLGVSPADGWLLV